MLVTAVHDHDHDHVQLGVSEDFVGCAQEGQERHARQGPIHDHQGRAHKLAVKLTRAGKKFLAAKNGHVKVGSVISETVGKHTRLTQRNLTLTMKLKKAKK